MGLIRVKWGALTHPIGQQASDREKGVSGLKPTLKTSLEST